MLEAYNQYMKMHRELFVLAQELETCTGEFEREMLLYFRKEVIGMLRKARAILNQKECDLLINGENPQINFD